MSASGEHPCPLCGAPLYGWIVLPSAADRHGLATRPDAELDRARVLDRCESCGVALAGDHPPDLVAEWRAIGGGDDAVRAPNRASIQAAIGAEGWAGIGTEGTRLLLTPRSLGLLAERNGAAVGPVRTPPTGRAQGWMWQTLLNGLTFHPNFAREVRAGRLRARNARGRFRFAVDCVVTVLAAPLVLLISAPLELVAALLRRGGELGAGVARG